MPSYNLAIVGMGNVGRALLRLLISKETDLRRRGNSIDSTSRGLGP